MTAEETEQAEFIEQQRSWIRNHKADTGLSWAELGKRTQIKESTLSLFGGDKGYAGREHPLAEAVMRYRQALTARDTTHVDAPEIPEYFETQTSLELISMLHWAQRGKMISAPIGSGVGKSTAAMQFAALYPNVFYGMIPPSRGSQGPMQIAILRWLGVKNAAGTPSSLTQMISDRLSAMHRPLLIVDEAQNLTVPALEELRFLYDDIKVGIALFGDQRLSQLINNGTGKNDLPQLRSRLRQMPARMQPYGQDVAALARAWNITDRRMILELERIAMKPGALRLTTQVLETAAMMASSESKVMELGHLQEAASEVMRRERVL